MRVELPIVSFISALLVLLPLPWHWRARNVSTISAILWLAACNIIHGVNSIIWAGNVIVQYEIWCDITTKLIIGANVGIPASVLCVCRRLAQVASPRPTISKAGDQHQRRKFDIGMCVVLPGVFMALHYIVQGRRFVISEDFGCEPGVYMSVVALILIPIPPLLLSVTALVYGGVALRWLIHRRYQNRPMTISGWRQVISGHYLRLFILSVTEMTLATTMSFYIFLNWLGNDLAPWDSWETVHQYWSQIPVTTNDEIPELVLAKVMVTWYVVPISSVVFSTFFGLGDQAMAEYRKLFVWIKVRIFRAKPRLAPILPETTQDIDSTSNPTVVSPFNGPQTEVTRAEANKANDIPLFERMSSGISSPPLLGTQGAPETKVYAIACTEARAPTIRAQTFQVP